MVDETYFPPKTLFSFLIVILKRFKLIILILILYAEDDKHPILIIQIKIQSSLQCTDYEYYARNYGSSAWFIPWKERIALTKDYECKDTCILFFIFKK